MQFAEEPAFGWRSGFPLRRRGTSRICASRYSCSATRVVDEVLPYQWPLIGPFRFGSYQGRRRRCSRPPSSALIAEEIDQDLLGVLAEARVRGPRKT